MINSTSERRQIIVDGVLLPRLVEAMDAQDRAEQAREEALGALKAAKGALRTANDDLRHVKACRDIACRRCGALVPGEVD